jgi:hypothetical protein
VEEADRLYDHPWRVTSLLRSGVCTLDGVDVDDLEYVVVADRLFRKIVVDWESEHLGDDSAVDDDSVIYLDRHDVRSLWSRSKGGKSWLNGGLLSGPGSYRRFVGILMLMGSVGLIEGALGGEIGVVGWGRSCELGDLYRYLAYIEDDLRGVGVLYSQKLGDYCAILLFEGECDRYNRVGYCYWKCGDESADAVESSVECCGESSSAESGGSVVSELGASLEVYISLYCGTQSDREEAESLGYVYLGLDIVSHIYSSELKRWVRCVECDVDKLDIESLDCVVRGYLDNQGYQGRSYNIVHVGASPVCKSFSRADSCNRKRGCGYRDHNDPLRPPLTVNKGGSRVKYALAVAADKSVKHLAGLLMAVCECYYGCTFHLENPFGSLQHRPYMLDLLGVPYTVDYCAYGHLYQKMTNIWTNIDWVPQGNTLNGRCNNGKCGMGPPKASGKFQHWHALGQSSTREKSGKGRGARRIMVPRLLHREMLRSK